MKKYIFFGCLFTFFSLIASGQATPDSRPQYLQEGLPLNENGEVTNPRQMERRLRYLPDADAFVLQKGVTPRRFNRALYGNNEAFRLETGDTPEFGLYSKKGMMGNLSLLLSIDDRQLLWLNDLKDKEVIYRPGQRVYRFADPRLGENGSLTLTAMAAYNCQGALFEVECREVTAPVEMYAVFGGMRGKKFTRNGDLNVDPEDAFAMHPEYCLGNAFQCRDNCFSATRVGVTEAYGIFPQGAVLTIGSGRSGHSPKEVLEAAPDGQCPVVRAAWNVSDHQTCRFAIVLGDEHLFEKVSDGAAVVPDDFVTASWTDALTQIAEVRSHLKVETPDAFINAAAAALVMAADGIWESPVYQHGAVGWRVPLAGWRAAYTGDFLGWHDRGRTHFSSYAASQMHVPASKPALADSAMNLARPVKELGRPMYSEGYIARLPNDPTKMNHYDMNLCFIDELFWHLRWTGDMDFARRMWPVIQAHLAWEKKSFDEDGDGLYDAVAVIWASDAMQYSGGGVTHSSAYNYIANRQAADLARLLGENAEPYDREADHILEAVNRQLWMDSEGHWAEFKDILGHQLVHPCAGIHTIYHAIDSKLYKDLPMAYEATRYIDTDIPHIPVKIDRKDAASAREKGFSLADDYRTISTSGWMPYFWSINNVAFAEVMHTVLAYYQTGRSEEAFHLMKSSLMDGMFLGASPGNVGQISYYDASRGEMYRDFADPVGVYSRAFVEGLFGVEPDLLHGKVVLHPSLPRHWDFARFETADITMDFRRDAQGVGHWMVESRFAGNPSISLVLPICSDAVESVTLNAEERLSSLSFSEGIDMPYLTLDCGRLKHMEVTVKQSAKPIGRVSVPAETAWGQSWIASLPESVSLEEVRDAQHLFRELPRVTADGTLSGCFAEPVEAAAPSSHHTFFLRLKNRQFSWWQPVDVVMKNGEPSDEPVTDGYALTDLSEESPLPQERKQVQVSLKDCFNDRVVHIFVPGKYVSPRATSTTMQIPWQGYGDWCGPKAMPLALDDSGLRALAGNDGVWHSPLGIDFATPAEGYNAAFVSQWDNYPTRMEVPLKGKASHAYLLMAGTTNHMQYGMNNGMVRFRYADGTCDSLALMHPDTWAPVEQAFYIDDMAFRTDAPLPYRVELATGRVGRNPYVDFHLHDNVPQALSNPSMYRIPGGAALLLDLPLNASKRLKSVEWEAITIESVIGLMSLTLVR